MKKKVSSDFDIKSIAKKVISDLESTKDFALEHAPDICKRMILEAHIEAVFEIVAGIAILIVGGGTGAYLLYKGFSYAPQSEYDGVVGWYLGGTIIGGLSALFGPGLLFQGAKNYIFLKNCPKLFLLRQFRKLTR